MPKEIEKKFLVKSTIFESLGEKHYICQGFLSTDKVRVVRIRIIDDNAFITVKGKSQGATRFEFEYAIPLEDARFLLDQICLRPTIEKYRYKILYEGFTWEIDKFLGENEGLIVAEIELDSEDQQFPVPEWIGMEITSDPRYYNANLVSNPYKSWKT